MEDGDGKTSPSLGFRGQRKATHGRCPQKSSFTLFRQKIRRKEKTTSRDALHFSDSQKTSPSRWVSSSSHLRFRTYPSSILKIPRSKICGVEKKPIIGQTRFCFFPKTTVMLAARRNPFRLKHKSSRLSPLATALHLKRKPPLVVLPTTRFARHTPNPNPQAVLRTRVDNTSCRRLEELNRIGLAQPGQQQGL